MKLNRLEFLLMNNPIRALVQEKHEVRILRDMTSIGNIQRALEIGCGNGHGTKLIKKYFGPRLIDAVDLDEKMIEIAKGKNDDSSIRYHVMDASELSFPDNAFDAIFDFGIIHHIPNWRDCVSEMYRVSGRTAKLFSKSLQPIRSILFQAARGSNSLTTPMTRCFQRLNSSTVLSLRVLHSEVSANSIR